MEITQTNEQPQLAVATKISSTNMANIGEVATTGLQKVFQYLAGKGVQMVGAPYLAYSNGNADFTQFDVELGIPVASEIATDGEFFMSKTAEGKAVTAMHQGAYKDVEAVYMALMDYMAQNGLESTGVYYDYYVNDPANTPEEQLLTKVVFPIK